MGFLGEILNAFDVPRKSKGSAYASLIFVGLIGWHQFYLENILRGILYVLAFLALMTGWLIPITLLAYIGAGALVIFFVFDFFTLWRQVNKWNEENAGNSLIDMAGQIAGSVISIPLNNAIEEYNGVVANFKKSIERFKKEKSEVELLLGRLQEARNDALTVISRMKEIIANISPKDKELVQDALGEEASLSNEIFNQKISGKQELTLSLEQSIDAASQEMAETFNAAREFTQMFETNAGKFAAATAATVIQGVVEYGKQQQKVAELKKEREKILKQQNEIEIKIRQLEATEKRASEILKVIEGEMPGFNHIYNEFCKAVFPNGILEKKEAAALSIEERKLLKDLSEAARKVIAVGSQEIEKSRETAVIKEENPNPHRPEAKKLVESVPQSVTIKEKLICSNCKAIIDDGAKFCNNCGAAVITSIACTNCNTVNTPDSKFCIKCGGLLQK